MIPPGGGARRTAISNNTMETPRTVNANQVLRVDHHQLLAASKATITVTPTDTLFHRCHFGIARG
jgi:hypothetical protein